MRAVWSGNIRFGLVNIPVKIYSATSSEKIHFRNLHEKDNVPVKRKWWCPKHDEEVKNNEIKKGYEIEEGEYIVLDDEDIEKAKINKNGDSLDIKKFVDTGEISPLYFDKNYYVSPYGSDKAFFYFKIH